MSTFTFFNYSGVDPIEWFLFFLVIAFASFAGGLVGVGAVVIVPAGIALLKEDPKVAISSSILGFVLYASVGAYSYKNLLLAIYKTPYTMAFGATIGGFAAAFGLRAIPTGALKIAIGLFAGIFGLKALLQVILKECKMINFESNTKILKNDIHPQRNNDKCFCHDCIEEGDEYTKEEKEEDGVRVVWGSGQIFIPYSVLEIELDICSTNTWTSILMGLFIGFCSAITGTSGPLITIPTTMLVRPLTPAVVAVGLAHFCGVPMAVAMTLGNIVNDQQIDLGFALVVSIGGIFFVPLGKFVATQMIRYGAKGDSIILLLISIVMVATGAYVVVRAV